MKRFGWHAIVIAVVVLIPMASLRAQPSVEGQWSGTIPFNNIEAIHSTLLPTGKVLFWNTNSANATSWDPVTGQFSDIANPSVNIFCSGHAWLPDGRLMVVGGHIQNNEGKSVADIYDPFTDTWANSDADPNNNVPEMNAGRWYPSATTLGNGDVLVMSGDISPSIGVNTLPQVYEVATNTWRDLSTATKALPLYPRTFLAPGGGVASLSNYGNTTEMIDVTGTGSWSYLDNTLDSNLYNYGTAVMYDTGKVAYIGGGNTPTANISLMDLGSATPEWTYAADTMAHPRRQNDGTILADGTVLITGGTSVTGFNDPNGLIAETEIWDPVTGQVSQLADADPAIYRGYHSTATLLPDGRVLITGGDHSDGGYTPSKNAEIYSPPYLFNGARPTVASAPSVVDYGETFLVETPDAASIADALWVVPGSTTHAQNWTQRANHLAFTEVAGGLEITVPSNPNEAPPGNYMLFLVNDNGVPSMAEWVQAQIPTFTADYDGDGDVDSDDLTDPADGWEARFGNDLTGSDFLAWQQQLGSGVGAVSSSTTAVPEPDSIVVCAAFLALSASTWPRQLGRRR